MHDAELICLDLDGCLVDSTEAITTGIATALAMYGLAAPPPAELRWCVGPPLRESMAILFATLGGDPDLVADCMETYREVYAATWFGLTRVFDGLVDVLGDLAGDGRRLAVVTSKPAPIAGPIIDGMGLRPLLEAVHAPDSDHGSEPKTVTLTRALAALLPAAEPSRAVMVGDRQHDVVAGRACGTFTVGVTWGAGDRDELEAAGADRVVDTPAQLAEVFG